MSRIPDGRIAGLPLHLDLDRPRRTGVPEAVYAPGKTPAEVAAAAARLFTAHRRVLVTRADAEQQAAAVAAVPGAVAHARSGIVSAGAPKPALGPVAVVSAGTADEPWAEECALVLAHAAVRVRRFPDCGVAGLHRVLGHLPGIRRCVCVVVVAGMDGALPSVLGGLVDIPLIACPTPVGYGTGEGGRAALTTMLNACSAGVTVVNIGNGFGAAVAAAAICRAVRR
jgi:NCAIR mutase (PurE)-related protein